MPAKTKAKVKGQGHEYAFSIGVHDLKYLYTKYEHCYIAPMIAINNFDS